MTSQSACHTTRTTPRGTRSPSEPPETLHRWTVVPLGSRPRSHVDGRGKTRPSRTWASTSTDWSGREAGAVGGGGTSTSTPSNDEDVPLGSVNPTGVSPDDGDCVSRGGGPTGAEVIVFVLGPSFRRRSSILTTSTHHVRSAVPGSFPDLEPQTSVLGNSHDSVLTEQVCQSLLDHRDSRLTTLPVFLPSPRRTPPNPTPLRGPVGPHP